METLLETNAIWLRPFAQCCPNRVPSGFFCADVLLRLHELLDRKLLVAPEGHRGDDPLADARSLAASEGNKLKKLLGYLRYLLRNSIRGKRQTVLEAHSV